MSQAWTWPGHGRYTQDLGPSPISPTLTLSTGTADCVLWTRSSLGAECEQHSKAQVQQMNPWVRDSRRWRQWRAEGGSLHYADSRREVTVTSPQTLPVGFPGDWLSSHQCDKPLLCPVAAGLTPASPWVWRSSSTVLWAGGDGPSWELWGLREQGILDGGRGASRGKMHPETREGEMSCGKARGFLEGWPTASGVS